MSGSRKDPVAALPFIPSAEFRDPTLSGDLVKSRLTMVNRSIAVIRSLTQGSVSGALGEPPSDSAVWRSWRSATPVQKQLATRVAGSWKRWFATSDAHDGAFSLATLLRTTNATGTQVAQRGDMCPCVPPEVSLPPPGTTPVDLGDVAPSVKPYLANMETDMLLTDEEVDWDEYERI